MISTADSKLISLLYLHQNINILISPQPATDLKMDLWILYHSTEYVDMKQSNAIKFIIKLQTHC